MTGELPVENLKFRPAGTTHGVTLANFASEYALSVKDFGAAGDDTEDDTIPIQTCLDTAFGGPLAIIGPDTPHGATNKHLNRPVYFPPGNYKVTGLTVNQVMGGRIYGSSRAASYIKTLAGTADTTLLRINGFENSTIEDLGFRHQGPYRVGSICLDIDWTGSPTDVKLQYNTINRINCEDSEIGMRIGASGLGGKGHLTGVGAFNCLYGQKFMAADYTGVSLMGGGADCWLGYGQGSASVRGAGFWQTGGNNLILNPGGAGGQTDFIWDSPGKLVITGGRSESWNVLKITNGSCIMSGFIYGQKPEGFWEIGADYHPPGSMEHVFIDMTSPAVVVLDNCWGGEQGIIFGNGTAYIRGGTGSLASDWLSHFTGTIREFVTMPELTFATLPSAEIGCEINISNARTATGAWGEPAIASGGTLVSGGHGLVRWNGTAWTLVGK